MIPVSTPLKVVWQPFVCQDEPPLSILHHMFCQTSSLEKGQGIKWRQGAPISTLNHLSVGEVRTPEFLVKPEVCIYD